MTQGEFAGLWTFIALIAFLGVCVWAYGRGRKASFEEAARLPFADEPESQDGESEDHNETTGKQSAS